MLRHVLDIDDGGSARHRDGLLDRFDAQLTVHRRRESGGELDAFPFEGAEARQRERDDVQSGSQIDDPIEALAVSSGGTKLSIRTGLEASTMTPGMTAPDESRTVPAMLPVSAWAQAAVGRVSTHDTRSPAILRAFIVSSLRKRTETERLMRQKGE